MSGGGGIQLKCPGTEESTRAVSYVGPIISYYIKRFHKSILTIFEWSTQQQPVNNNEHLNHDDTNMFGSVVHADKVITVG